MHGNCWVDLAMYDRHICFKFTPEGRCLTVMDASELNAQTPDTTGNRCFKSDLQRWVPKELTRMHWCGQRTYLHLWPFIRRIIDNKTGVLLETTGIIRLTLAGLQRYLHCHFMKKSEEYSISVHAGRTWRSDFHYSVPSKTWIPTGDTMILVLCRESLWPDRNRHGTRQRWIEMLIIKNGVSQEDRTQEQFGAFVPFTAIVHTDNNELPVSYMRL